MSISLTDAAIHRVREFMAREGGRALRVGVKRTGCSGWAYVVGLAETIEPGDHQFEDAGITIVVDAESLPLVDGSRIDFVIDGLNRTFKFDNPNATEECGCGESFTIQ
ncbi:iron-sulfur cluster assembly accessory protein [Marinihelvus fidelis]|uniref:Iron-sulfur cluster assembly accessory protein n=1 Tax=Marinihelvus fidelis TaxID=2613842 RepID=A0A5N0TBT8_9GAMM|nr:iron-sulfur cluster assembly accessory protein [Marinihelvus fidelis]KAA9131884.1 iron-sulfur cluster assembly accessory protein [Marinihelvus fidelis]